MYNWCIIFLFLGCHHSCCSQTDSKSRDIEFSLHDKAHWIGQLISDIKELDYVDFTACYQKYHIENDLETFFEVAYKVLVSNKTIKEGVDFAHLEQFIDECWNLEVQEHDGNEAEAYLCYKKQIKDRILHGWVLNHLPEGRGFLGKMLKWFSFLNDSKAL